MAGEWPTAPLSDLTELDTPVTYGVVKPGPEDRDGVYLIRGGDIANGRILTSQLRTITRAVSEQYRRTQLRGGEIVVSLVGNPGQVAIVPQSLRGANIARQAGLVRLRQGVDARFVKYFLSSRYGQEALGAHSLGSVQQVINLRDLKTVQVPFPPLPEQRAIAHILCTLDDKIELNWRTNETIEAMARALFKAWFVDFEPVRAKMEGCWQRGQSPPGLPAHLYDLFPDRLVDSELGEIPEGWRVGSVYDIADVRYGAPFASSKFNSNGNGLPLVRIRDLRDERPGVWTQEIHPKGYLIQPGDIIVGMDGEFRAYLWGGDPAWMNQRICTFHSKQPYCPVFVRNAIEPHLARVEATEIATTVIHLGKGDIDEFRVVIPEDKVAREFERLGQPLFDKIVLSKQQSAILAKQRDTLLPKLISGELRVTDAEAFLGEHGL